MLCSPSAQLFNFIVQISNFITQMHNQRHEVWQGVSSHFISLINSMPLMGSPYTYLHYSGVTSTLLPPLNTKKEGPWGAG